MAEGSELKRPDYAAGEKEGFVQLDIKIRHLKVKSTGIPGFVKKVLRRQKDEHPHPEGKNAQIVVPEYHVRGFELNVKGDPSGEMKGAQYRLQIKRLPYDIDTDYCYITAEDGMIYMFLKKCDEKQSWERYIREGNLETAEKESK